MSLLYLGLIFGGGGWVYYRIQHFEGITVVGLGKAETLAMRPRGEGNPFSVNYRNLPFDVLPLAEPGVVRKVLDSKVHYDAADLPAALTLTRLETWEVAPPEEYIEIESEGEKTRIPAIAGEEFNIAGQGGTVLRVEPWVGLIAHAQGAPLALVKFAGDGPDGFTQQKLFLESKTWHYHENYALYFDWFATEEQARAALPRTRPTQESARWGVADGKRIHWLNSFAEGTGVELDNGNEISLLGAKFEEGMPIILVQIKRPNNTASRIRILPGEVREGIRLEYPAVKEKIAYLHAWRDNYAWLRVIDGEGRATEAIALEAGATSHPEIELVSAFQRALPVDNTGDPLYHALVRWGDAEYELREGLRITLPDGEAAMTYQRLPAPLGVRYHLHASAGDGTQADFALSGEETQRIKDWNLSLHPQIKPAPDTVVLLAERSLGGSSKYVGLGLFMVGAFGWVFVRLLKPSAEKRDARIEDHLDAMLSDSAKADASEEEKETHG